jgi:tRNA pseudouridine13 synthase
MLVPAIIKQRPEDFVVEEVPLYPPSGTGEHVFVTFEKRGQNTLDAVRTIAQALGANPRDAGVAGMKDRHAVTTQTISLLTPRGKKSDELAAAARALSLEGIRVLDATPHGNKLKTGHLAGNRFTIVVRGVPREALTDAMERLRRVGDTGVPNAFGEQRFGRDHDNAERAKAWLRGDAMPPRDPKKKRLLFSALQSSVFNAVLDRRVSEGTWTTPLLGDVLKKTDSGGLFLCEDATVDGERALRGEVVPTGPIFGPKMVRAQGGVGELELEVMEPMLTGLALQQATGLGEGTRRPLVLNVQELEVEEILPNNGEEAGSCRVYFVIPKGAYATIVLRQVFTWPDPSDEGSQRND